MFKNGIPPMYGWSSAAGGGLGTKANSDEVYFWGGNASLSGSGLGSGTNYNTIDYFDRTSTTSNAVDRGDDIVAQRGGSGVHNTTRAMRLGAGSSGSFRFSIAEIDLTSQSGNASDVADMNQSYSSGSTAVSGPVFGYAAGGGSTYINIEYVTIATQTGNATDTGDLDYNGKWSVRGVSGQTYGHFCGGHSNYYDGKQFKYNSLNNISYIDITSTSVAGTDRGDLAEAKRAHCTVGGGTYGYACGGTPQTGGGFLPQGNSYNGASQSVNIDYFDITTNAGNAADRADLPQAHNLGTSQSDSQGFTNGIVGSGDDFATLDVTTTTGNASDRGDRTLVAYNVGTCN